MTVMRRCRIYTAGGLFVFLCCFHFFFPFLALLLVFTLAVEDRTRYCPNNSSIEERVFRGCCCCGISYGRRWPFTSVWHVNCPGSWTDPSTVTAADGRRLYWIFYNNTNVILPILHFLYNYFKFLIYKLFKIAHFTQPHFLYHVLPPSKTRSKLWFTRIHIHNEYICFFTIISLYNWFFFLFQVSFNFLSHMWRK